MKMLVPLKVFGLVDAKACASVQGYRKKDVDK